MLLNFGLVLSSEKKIKTTTRTTSVLLKIKNLKLVYLKKLKYQYILHFFVLPTSTESFLIGD